jgi:hypothetical protein
MVVAAESVCTAQKSARKIVKKRMFDFIEDKPAQKMSEMNSCKE